MSAKAAGQARHAAGRCVQFAAIWLHCACRLTAWGFCCCCVLLPHRMLCCCAAVTPWTAVCCCQVMDSNKDGFIAFDEFAKWWSSRKAPKPAAAKQAAKV